MLRPIELVIRQNLEVRDLLIRYRCVVQGGRLAAQVNWEAPPEADHMEKELNRLIRQHGDDPDFEEVINKKKMRLDALMTKPNIDEKLLSNIAPPGFWATAPGELVVEMLQRVVKEIQIENQRPVKLVMSI